MTKDKEVQVLVRMTADMAAQLDEFRRNADGIPSRPEAVRQLIQMSLRGEGGKKLPSIEK